MLVRHSDTSLSDSTVAPEREAESDTPVKG